jgi:hypothetical protein
MLIVCGSATSWIVKNLINNHGGLYNRLTATIELSPFTLHETGQFLQSKNIIWSKYQIADIYMIMGGIPFYLVFVNLAGTSLYARRGKELYQWAYTAITRAKENLHLIWGRFIM